VCIKFSNFLNNIFLYSSKDLAAAIARLFEVFKRVSLKLIASQDNNQFGVLLCAVRSQE
jgi:hypothetical protein